MKNIKNKIFEAKQNLVSEVQNEYRDNYAYQSFAYSNGKKNFNYGFLIFDNYQEFYSVTAFNEDSEEIENFAGEYDVDLEEIMELKVGQTYEDSAHGEQYAIAITRIW